VAFPRDNFHSVGLRIIGLYALEFKSNQRQTFCEYQQVTPFSFRLAVVESPAVFILFVLFKIRRRKSKFSEKTIFDPKIKKGLLSSHNFVPLQIVYLGLWYKKLKITIL